MSLPSLELLEQTHRFPGDYTFKVIGENTPTFTDGVLEAVSRVVTVDPTHTTKTTKGGKHISVTVVARVTSAQAVLDVYKELGKVPDALMVF